MSDLRMPVNATQTGRFYRKFHTENVNLFSSVTNAIPQYTLCSERLHKLETFRANALRLQHLSVF